MHVHPLFSINYFNERIMNPSSLITWKQFLKGIITIKRIRVIMARQERLILILSAAYIFSILQEKEKKKKKKTKITKPAILIILIFLVLRLENNCGVRTCCARNSIFLKKFIEEISRSTAISNNRGSLQWSFDTNRIACHKRKRCWNASFTLLSRLVLV